jgi:hypothetical protein
MSITKVYRGQLEGSGQGEFFSPMGNEKGSAPYLAVQRVAAAMHEKVGTFVLYRREIMT